MANNINKIPNVPIVKPDVKELMTALQRAREAIEIIKSELSLAASQPIINYGPTLTHRMVFFFFLKDE